MSIDLQALSPLVPTYGNYGGPDYSDGVHLQPGQNPTYTVPPVDALDALFLQHDMTSQAPDSMTRALGDLALIQGIDALPDAAFTPEGHLYAGAATVAMLADIAFRQNHPELLTPNIVAAASENAFEHIASGSAAQTPWLGHSGIPDGLFFV
jgi:hypothetical protein